MFTLSRSFKNISIVCGLFCLSSGSVFSASAEGRKHSPKPALSPTSQSVLIGSTVRIGATGRACSVRLADGSLRSFRGRSVFMLKMGRPGVFQVRMRCGRVLKTASVRVANKALPAQPKPAPKAKPEAKPQPKLDTSLHITEMERWFERFCGKNPRAAYCTQAIEIMVPAYRQWAIESCMWFREYNCDPVKYPYGNPFDTSGFYGGVCSAWVSYQRHEMIEKIEMTYYREWLEHGAPLWQGMRRTTTNEYGTTVEYGEYPILDWGHTFGGPWSPSDAWTTWAKKAGYQVSQTPSDGAVFVQANHVGLVKHYEPSDGRYLAQFTTSEMNLNGGRGKVRSRTIAFTPEMIKNWQMWFIS